jgi:hypothetical protein
MRARPLSGRATAAVQIPARRTSGQVGRPQVKDMAAVEPTRLCPPLFSPTSTCYILPPLPDFTRCRHPRATAIALRSGWPAARVSCANANVTRRFRSAHSARCKSKASCQDAASQPDRKGFSCDYSRPDPHTPPSEFDRTWYIHPGDEEQTDFQSIDFPTVLFLDPTILQHGQVDISRATLPVPTHMLHLLGNMGEMHLIASSYFENIHTWMPFISKKRFYGSHLRHSSQTQPDVVLLLLALKLITTTPPPRPRNPRTPLYYAVKHFHLDVESSSTSTIVVLQAGILLSLYEILHAIYPAAFQSIGACARYAHALGINVCKSLKTRKILTLVEVEERRRVWWAIVILDRFVYIHCLLTDIIVGLIELKVREYRQPRQTICDRRSWHG